MKEFLLKPLSTSDINACLNKYKHFKGTFPADGVFFNNSKQLQFYVINTEKHTESGEHWTALVIEQKNKVLFFNSFGVQLLNIDILRQMEKQGVKKYIYSSQQIQPLTSDACGFYCIAFIIAYHNNISYSNFIEMFSSSMKGNDEICYKFITH